MPKRIIIPLVLVLVLAGVGLAFGNKIFNPGKKGDTTTGPTAAPSVNVIPLDQRPYVTLQPLQGRNELEFVVHNLPIKAESVEVVLEYERNKGVPDAVLKDFMLTKIPNRELLFLGSKSAGGHITFHDDVTGGLLKLTFDAEDGDDYALEVPWRYDDTQPRYTQVSTRDSRFQMVLAEPLRTPKYVAMQSPGLPKEINAKVIAGPYLVRGVGPLPEMTAEVTIHLSDPSEKAKMMAWNGEKWVAVEATNEGGRTLKAAKAPLAEVYIAVEE